MNGNSTTGRSIALLCALLACVTGSIAHGNQLDRNQLIGTWDVRDRVKTGHPEPGARLTYVLTMAAAEDGVGGTFVGSDGIGGELEGEIAGNTFKFSLLYRGSCEGELHGQGLLTGEPAELELVGSYSGSRCGQPTEGSIVARRRYDPSAAQQLPPSSHQLPEPPPDWFSRRNASEPDAEMLEFHAAMEEAAASHRKALERDRTNEELRWNLASALEWLGKPEEAAELFSDPDYPGKDSGIEAAPREVDPAKFEKPVKLQDVRPDYPEPARRARAQGTVRLETVIDSAGDIASVKVLETLAGCTAAAIRAARQWKFSPATLEGKPFPVYLTLSVDFTLTTRGRHAQP